MRKGYIGPIIRNAEREKDYATTSTAEMIVRVYIRENCAIGTYGPYRDDYVTMISDKVSRGLRERMTDGSFPFVCDVGIASSYIKVWRKPS